MNPCAARSSRTAPAPCARRPSSSAGWAAGRITGRSCGSPARPPAPCGGGCRTRTGPCTSTTWPRTSFGLDQIGPELRVRGQPDGRPADRLLVLPVDEPADRTFEPGQGGLGDVESLAEVKAG